ncbi:MAG TPA: hypothetical protein VF015_01450 [Acidimicrobiales bacterium]
MTLLWAVPVAAAAAATLLVAARARAIEDEAVALARATRQLREVRAPLDAIRTTAAETDSLVAAFRSRHPVDGGPVDGSR